MIIPVLLGAAKVGTMMVGAGFATEGVKQLNKRFNPSEKVSSIVGGVVDTVQAVADPLNLSGLRERSLLGQVSSHLVGEGTTSTNRQLARFLDPWDLFGTQKNAEEKNIKDAASKARKDEAKKTKAAEDSAKKARKEVAKARAGAIEKEKKIAELEAQGKTQQAELEKQKASISDKWAQTAEKAIAKAESLTKENADRAYAMAQAALDFGKKAVNPPSTAAEAFTDDMTDQAKALVANLVDRINRFSDDSELDEVLEAIESDDIAGLVAGPSEKPIVAGCCSSCASGAGSCSCSKGVVDSFMIDGPEDFKLDDIAGSERESFVAGMSSFYVEFGSDDDDDDDDDDDLIEDDEDEEFEIWD